MTARHTPEPWESWQPALNGVTWPIYAAALEDYAAEAATEANAARIVACVNALAGVEDPAAYLADLFNKLRAVEDDLRKTPARPTRDNALRVVRLLILNRPGNAHQTP